MEMGVEISHICKIRVFREVMTELREMGVEISHIRRITLLREVMI